MKWQITELELLYPSLYLHRIRNGILCRFSLSFSFWEQKFISRASRIFVFNFVNSIVCCQNHITTSSCYSHYDCYYDYFNSWRERGREVADVSMEFPFVICDLLISLRYHTSHTISINIKILPVSFLLVHFVWIHMKWCIWAMLNSISNELNKSKWISCNETEYNEINWRLWSNTGSKNEINECVCVEQ